MSCRCFPIDFYCVAILQLHTNSAFLIWGFDSIDWGLLSPYLYACCISKCWLLVYIETKSLWAITKPNTIILSVFNRPLLEFVYLCALSSEFPEFPVTVLYSLSLSLTASCHVLYIGWVKNIVLQREHEQNCKGVRKTCSHNETVPT